MKRFMAGWTLVHYGITNTYTATGLSPGTYLLLMDYLIFQFNFSCRSLAVHDIWTYFMLSLAYSSHSLYLMAMPHLSHHHLSLWNKVTVEDDGSE